MRGSKKQKKKKKSRRRDGSQSPAREDVSQDRNSRYSRRRSRHSDSEEERYGKKRPSERGNTKLKYSRDVQEPFDSEWERAERISSQEKRMETHKKDSEKKRNRKRSLSPSGSDGGDYHIKRSSKDSYKRRDDYKDKVLRKRERQR